MPAPAKAADDPPQLGAAVADGGEVPDRGDRGLGGDALDDAQRAVPRGPAGTVGDGDEGRVQRLELADGLPELPLPLVGLRREELERVGGLAGGEQITHRLRARSGSTRPPLGGR